MDKTAVFKQYHDCIDQGMKVLVDQLSPGIREIIYYHFGWEDGVEMSGSQGKKVRSILTLLVHEATTGDFNPAIPLAVAIELTHNFTLILDDMEDRDLERRGRPTLWKKLGEGLAVNAGSLLYSLAFQSMNNLDIDRSKMAHMLSLFSQASISLAEGQHLDLMYENTAEITQDMYFEVIGKKTATLLSYPTLMAATLATEDEAIIEAFNQFGWNLGVAYQIRDDYLNIWGDAEVLGLKMYSDIRKKKKCLPVIYALETLSAEGRKQLQAIYSRNEGELDAAEVEQVLGLLEKSDAKANSVATFKQYHGQALQALSQVPRENHAMQFLAAMTHSLQVAE
ncbi:MAG: polyprenyl synthetase family protein [Anaerolineales bacterium]|nr:polyprenyl synthetase family protein [Anaerolineales bacterium]